MAKEEVKGTKERSALYPAISLNECVEFIQVIDGLGGRKVSLEVVAKTLNISTTTYSFKAKVSSSKQFGLIKSSAGTVELTEVAKILLYPTDDGKIKETLNSCFSSPPLYKKLIEKYKEQALPTEEKLGNILFQEYGITRSAKDVAAKRFIESAEYVGSLQNGVLLLNDEIEEVVTESPVDTKEKEDIHEVRESSDTTQTPICDEYQFTIPTLSAAVAKVSIPKNITLKDLDYILLYIQSMLPAFIENLKGEL